MGMEYIIGSSFNDRIDRAVDYCDATNRVPILHLMEEYKEVVNFTSRGNAVEEIGDLIFTALRYVNSELRDNSKVTLEEVLTELYKKLGKDKDIDDQHG